MEEIKVTVIIPVWNQEVLITKALESIPKRKDLEIIVIDDASTDKTNDMVVNFISNNINLFANITLIHNEKNLGLGLTLNEGLKKAKGEYVVQLDSDDYFITDNCNQIIEQYLTGNDMVYFDLQLNDGSIWGLNSYTHTIWCGAVKFMKRSFIQGLLFQDRRYAQDWYFYQEVLKRGPTQLFTNIIGTHYNHPRKNSLSETLGLNKED